MINALAIVLCMGPWDFSFPVDGLKDGNAAAFRERVLAHFKTLKDDGGEPVALEVRTKGALATITVNCAAGIRLSDIETALKGSEFSVKPAGWEVYGRIGLFWESATKLPVERIRALEGALKKIAKDVEFVEVLPADAKEGFAYHAHIRLGRRAAPFSEIAKALKAQDVEGATLLWERWPHMPWYDKECGARRITK